MDSDLDQKVIDAIDNSGYVFAGYGLLIKVNRESPTNDTFIRTYKSISPVGNIHESESWLIFKRSMKRDRETVAEYHRNHK
jgi:hypothetical protein